MINCGADKICINTGIFKNKKLIDQTAKIYGSQSIVVEIQSKKIGDKWFCLTDNGRINTYNFISLELPEATIDQADFWVENGIEVKIIKETMSAFDYLIQFSPWLLIILFWFFIMRRMNGAGGQGGIFSFAKSKATLVSSDKPKITFKDVAGCDEAKVELQEIVHFLKNSSLQLTIGLQSQTSHQ